MKTAFCFDLDGTITKQEILPAISMVADCYEEMQTLTYATIHGLIPFESSFKLRCKLLKEVPINVVQTIVSKIALHEKILKFIQSNTRDCFVITGNLDVWLAKLKQKLKCKVYCASACYCGNLLKGVNTLLCKGSAIKDIRQKHGFDRVVAIGDGMGDVQMFENACIGVAFGGVHSPVESLLEYAHYVTYSEEGLCKLLNTLL